MKWLWRIAFVVGYFVMARFMLNDEFAVKWTKRLRLDKLL